MLLGDPVTEKAMSSAQASFASERAPLVALPPIFQIQSRKNAAYEASHVTAAHMDEQILGAPDTAAQLAGVSRTAMILAKLLETLAVWSENPWFSVELISTDHKSAQSEAETSDNSYVLVTQNKSQLQRFPECSTGFNLTWGMS